MYPTITYVTSDPYVSLSLDVFYSCVPWLDECAAFRKTERDGGSLYCWVSCNLPCQVGGLGVFQDPTKQLAPKPMTNTVCDTSAHNPKNT